MPKFRFKAEKAGYVAWYLLPTIRFGLYSSGVGGFAALTFLKFDACVIWESK